MAIWHELKDEYFIVYIDENELTEEIIDRMRQVLTVAFLHRKYNIIFDLSTCNMIDSYFIGLLISTFRELKELGGTLKCVGVHGQVAQAFEIIRLNQIIEIFNSTDEAIQASEDTTSLS